MFRLKTKLTITRNKAFTKPYPPWTCESESGALFTSDHMEISGCAELFFPAVLDVLSVGGRVPRAQAACKK